MGKKIIGSNKTYWQRIFYGVGLYIRIFALIGAYLYLFINNSLGSLSVIIFVLMFIVILGYPLLSNRNYLFSVSIIEQIFIVEIKDCKNNIKRFEYPLSEIKVETTNNFFLKYSNEILIIYHKNICVKKQKEVCGWDKTKFEEIINLCKEEKQKHNLPINNYIKYV